MDLSLIPRWPPPEIKAVRFVYPRKRKPSQTLRSLLIALIAISVVTRKLYLRSFTTERLLWDDCKCMLDKGVRRYALLTATDLCICAIVCTRS